MTTPNAWQYDTLQHFSDEYYADLLMPQHVTGTRQPLKLDGKDEPATICYVLEKNKKLYAIPEELISELPILAKSVQTITYGRNVYDYVTEYVSARFKPEIHMTFKQMVDNFIPFEHTNDLHFTLWKIIVLASFVDRVNVRVATQAGFGKDSAVKSLGCLTGDVVVVHCPTIAKLEWCLHNKIIMANEISDLPGEERRHVEQFLLTAGDLSNSYTKRSRANMSGAQETYNISKISLLLCYNTIDHYPDPEKYFDNVYQRAVPNRFLPFKFSGVLKQDFSQKYNSVETSRENKQFYVQFIRTLSHLKINKDQLEGHTLAGASFNSDRWARHWNTLTKYVWLYSDGDEDTFKLLATELYTTHQEYLRMNLKNAATSYSKKEVVSNDGGLQVSFDTFNNGNE